MSHQPSNLRAHLNNHGIVPNKKLGQCFLVSETALEEIVKTSEIKEQERILEIGPGTGILTEKLLEKESTVVACEKDKRLFEMLTEKFQKEIQTKKLFLVLGDFLKLDFPNFLKNLGFEEKKYKVISNLPYQITSPVFKILLEKNFLPSDIVLTIQNEVAERICARAGEMNSLGVLVQSMSQKCFIQTKLPPSSFSPEPRVDSAIIKVEGVNYPEKMEVSFLRNVLRIGFSSRRKKLIKNLKNVFFKEKVDSIWEKLKMAENARAQDLSVEKWQKLVRELDK